MSDKNQTFCFVGASTNWRVNVRLREKLFTLLSKNPFHLWIGICQRTTDKTGNVSYAKNQANSNWDDYFDSYPSRFCTCGNNKTWNYSTSIDLTCISHESLVTAASVKVTYNNPCGSSKSGTIGITNGRSTVASRSITIPTGSGTKTENFYWTGGQKCGELTATGGDSGTC